MASLVVDLRPDDDKSWLTKELTTTAVTEFSDSQSDTLSPVVSGIGAKADAQHQWKHYPTERSIRHQSGDMVYFPEKLSDVIAWTDAFVDRIALLTTQAEKDHAEKERKLHDALKQREQENKELKDERKHHEQDTKKLQEKLNTANKDLETLRNLLIESKTCNTEMEKKIVGLEKKIAEQNEQFNKSQNELDLARRLAARTQKTNDETAADLLRHLQTYDKGAIPAHPGYENSSIRIISVVYGLKEYTWACDKQVLVNLYNAAALKDKSFHVTTELFGVNASQGKGKSCAITYAIPYQAKGSKKESGLLETIFGVEGSTLKFKHVPT